MTIIVPIDFSQVSILAADYALQLSQMKSDAQYVLYHSHYTELEIDASIHAIETIAEQLQAKYPNANIQTVVNKVGLSAGLEALVAQHNASLVLMGITGKGKLEQKFIGSNTLNVASNLKLPVLIVPENIVFQPVETLLLALPYKKDLLEQLPMHQIETLMHDFNLKLELATVHKNQDPATLFTTIHAQQTLLHRWEQLKPNYKVLDGEDVAKTLIQYAEEQHASWICTMPGTHSLWETITKGSITTKLVYSGKFPIIVF